MKNLTIFSSSEHPHKDCPAPQKQKQAHCPGITIQIEQYIFSQDAPSAAPSETSSIFHSTSNRCIKKKYTQLHFRHSCRNRDQTSDDRNTPPEKEPLFSHACQMQRSSFPHPTFQNQAFETSGFPSHAPAVPGLIPTRPDRGSAPRSGNRSSKIRSPRNRQPCR